MINQRFRMLKPRFRTRKPMLYGCFLDSWFFIGIDGTD